MTTFIPVVRMNDIQFLNRIGRLRIDRFPPKKTVEIIVLLPPIHPSPRAIASINAEFRLFPSAFAFFRAARSICFGCCESYTA